MWLCCSVPSWKLENASWCLFPQGRAGTDGKRGQPGNDVRYFHLNGETSLFLFVSFAEYLNMFALYREKMGPKETTAPRFVQTPANPFVYIRVWIKMLMLRFLQGEKGDPGANVRTWNFTVCSRRSRRAQIWPSAPSSVLFSGQRRQQRRTRTPRFTWSPGFGHVRGKAGNKLTFRAEQHVNTCFSKCMIFGG